MKYFEHMVGGRSRTPGEAKIQAVSEFPLPMNKSQIRATITNEWILLKVYSELRGYLRTSNPDTKREN